MHLKASLMVEGICAEKALDNVWSSNPFKLCYAQENRVWLTEQNCNEQYAIKQEEENRQKMNHFVAI